MWFVFQICVAFQTKSLFEYFKWLRLLANMAKILPSRTCLQICIRMVRIRSLLLSYTHTQTKILLLLSLVRRYFLGHLLIQLKSVSHKPLQWLGKFVKHCFQPHIRSLNDVCSGNYVLVILLCDCKLYVCATVTLWLPRAARAVPRSSVNGRAVTRTSATTARRPGTPTRPVTLPERNDHPTYAPPQSLLVKIHNTVSPKLL